MYLQQAREYAEIWDLDIECRLTDCDALDSLKLNEKSDIVFFTGIL
jgi:hypothetical protein